MLAQLLAVAFVAHSAAESETPTADDGVRWFAVPNLAFDSDDGAVFGARGELVFDEEGFDPYQEAFVIHLIATSRGFQHHRFRYDRVGIGPARKLRLTAHLAWRQWRNDGYWGIGNRTAREDAFARAFDSDDPRRHRYRYSLFQPFAHLTLRYDLDETWQAFGSFNGKWSKIETYAGSLLEEQQPYGMDGGVTGIVSAGILYDSRKPEVTPDGGYFAELSARGTPQLPGGAGAFGGVFGSARGYWTWAPWLQAAGRVMSEWMFGDLPFYEMSHWGGAVPIAGFGGAETLRGVSFGRYRAPGKAIVNTELRASFAQHDFYGAPMRWQVVPYLDAGFVYGAGALATAEVADVFPIHPGAGLGIRVIYDEAFVGRIDSGLGLDPVVEPDGDIRYEPTLGLYVVFDHAY